MRLFHFSDDPGIEVFAPRPVLVPSQRKDGMDWLNGPLVWAISEQRQPMYLFPRDCPRILIWERPETTTADRERWFHATTAHTIAYIEYAWLDRVMQTPIHRYHLPETSFESLEDAGMYVSRETVTPYGMETLTDLPAALRGAGVELRVVESLAPLKGIWETSIHFSGIRLRNAEGWA